MSAQGALLLQDGAAPDNLRNDADVVRRLRVHRRATVSWPVVVRDGNVTCRGEIRNISVGGAGLRCAASFYVGSRLVLELDRGRSLPVDVRWSRMGFIGVEFAAPLSPDDPLIVASVAELPSEKRSAGITGTVVPLLVDTSPKTAEGAVAATDDSVARITASLERLARRVKRMRATFVAQQSARALERACRKQGYSWLTVSADHDQLKPRGDRNDRH